MTGAPDVLRGAVLVVGLVLVAAGVVVAAVGYWPASLWLLVTGGTMTAGVTLERAIYKPLLRERPGAGWVKTAERFIDPETGQEVDVFYNPTSGERQYVSQGPEKKR